MVTWNSKSIFFLHYFPKSIWGKNRQNRKKIQKKNTFAVSGSFGIKGNTCSQEFLLSSFFPKSSSNEKTASYQTLESSLQKLAAAAIKIILMKSFGGLFLLNRIWNLGLFGLVVESLIRGLLTLWKGCVTVFNYSNYKHWQCSAEPFIWENYEKIRHLPEQ